MTGKKRWVWEDWSAEELPEPHKGMTREEKGALLLRYVDVGRPVAKKTEPSPRWRTPWERLDFRDADLAWADLREAHLEGADLSEAHLEGAYLCGAVGVPELMLRAVLSAETCLKSAWTAVQIRVWLRAGARLPDEEIDKLPEEIRSLLLREEGGPTLSFSLPLRACE